MAKNSGGVRSSSKVRFILLEADIADGDFTQVTHAITSALKPPAVPHRALLGTASAVPKGMVAEAATEVEGDFEEESEVETPTPSRPRSSGSAPVYRTPERLDLDLSSFAPFAQAKNPPTEATKRHLVATFWFKEHFNTPNVTIDHVYSAYLAAGWSPKARDFDKPFRNLKRKGLVKRVEPGVYTITLPGIVEVRDMGRPVEREMGKPVEMDASA